MTGSIQHHLRRSGTCFTQGLTRCAVMRLVVARREDKATQQVFAGTAGTGRPVVVSVWNKKTGPGNQN